MGPLAGALADASADVAGRLPVSPLVGPLEGRLHDYIVRRRVALRVVDALAGLMLADDAPPSQVHPS